MNQSFLLKRGDMLALMRGSGSRIEVTGGVAWLTQLGDPNDYIMHDRRRDISSEGSVLVYAFDDCRVTLAVPAIAQVNLRRSGQPPVAIVRLPATRPLAALRGWFAFA